MASCKLLTDGLLHLRADLWPSKGRLSLGTNPIQACHDPGADRRPFQFCKDGRHLHHRPPEWSRSVDTLLLADQRYPGSIQFGHRLRYV
jgi:hypothetical protein